MLGMHFNIKYGMFGRYLEKGERVLYACKYSAGMLIVSCRSFVFLIQRTSVLILEVHITAI
jgi:hypothetical protein